MKQMALGKVRGGYGEVLTTLTAAARKKRPLDIKILAAYPAREARELVGNLIAQLSKTYLVDNIEVLSATTPEEAMRLIRENPDLPLIVSGLDPDDTFALAISIREMEADIRNHFSDAVPARKIIAVLFSDPENPFVPVYTGINDLVFAGPDDSQSVLSLLINRVVGFLATNKIITSTAHQDQLAICYRDTFGSDLKPFAIAPAPAKRKLSRTQSESWSDPDPTSSGDGDEQFCTSGSSFLTSGILDRKSEILSYSSSDFSESSSITSPRK